MKLISISVIFIFMFSVRSFAVENQKEIAMLKGTILAMQLSKAKTYGDLEKIFHLSKSDQNLFDTDLKSKKLLDKKLPHIQYKDAEIVFKDSAGDVVFDFEDIALQKLYMNGHKIDVSQKIPYAKALVMVKDILKDSRHTALMNWILPIAVADDGGSWFANCWAAVISSSSYGDPTDLKPRSASMALAETIIQTFDSLEPKYKKEFLEFTCKNNRLDKISNRMNSDSVGGAAKIQYTPGKGYTGSYTFVGAYADYQDDCSFQANEQGVITQMDEDDDAPEFKHADNFCAKKGTSLFDIVNIEETNSLAFGEYPKVADACCKDVAHKCAERVQAHTSQFWNQPPLHKADNTGKRGSDSNGTK